MKRKAISYVLSAALVVSLAGCGSADNTANDSDTNEQAAEETETDENSEASDSNADNEVSEEQSYIESKLNLANNSEQTWTYDSEADAWVLSVVSAVAYPEIEDEQGVSVCVPGAYVTGIDTDGDGQADVAAGDDGSSDGVQGSLVIDYSAEITSSNGQTYTAATAPVIVNTGAAGYASSTNTLAATSYASEGYINMSCGNRGKQDTATDENGDTYYTGDAPSCLVDQKDAIRFVKYNILLGNLPGSVDYFVSTGGSGGGAHATMVSATGNNPDFYDYEIAAGAVGVYETDDGYSTSVSIDGEEYQISDGVWGCIAYSAITSLAEADMAMAFEYYMDTDYDFNTDFQKQMAEYLSEEYMDYINDQNLSVEEAKVGFDLDEDGDTEDTVSLTIEYDADKYADTNGYGGTYLTLYLDEFESNLQNYLDNLDYASGWTWFNEDGTAMSDDQVAAMTSEDRMTAFIEGRYTKGSDSNGMMGGAPGGGMPDGAMPDGAGPDGMPDGAMPDGAGPDGMTDGAMPDGAGPDGMTDGAMPDGAGPDGMNDKTALNGEKPDGAPGDIGNSDGDAKDDRSFDNSDVAANSTGDTMDVGTPDAGTTQSVGSGKDSSNYTSFDEMLASYEEDIAEIESGDKYGNNIVELYNPLNYIGNDETDASEWCRIVCGASEGDISMFNSLNLEIAMLNAGIDCNIEWQWDGGHVPSEILGDSLSLYVDEMYGKYVDGAAAVTKAAADSIEENGEATEAEGKDLSSWVNYDDINDVTFTLSDAVSYRTAGASKATPGFDVMDYGQEDYVFGDTEADARHWDKYVLKVLQDHSDELSGLWNME